MLVQNNKDNGSEIWWGGGSKPLNAMLECNTIEINELPKFKFDLMI